MACQTTSSESEASTGCFVLRLNFPSFSMLRLSSLRRARSKVSSLHGRRKENPDHLRLRMRDSTRILDEIVRLVIAEDEHEQLASICSSSNLYISIQVRCAVSRPRLAFGSVDKCYRDVIFIVYVLDAVLNDQSDRTFPTNSHACVFGTGQRFSLFRPLLHEPFNLVYDVGF